MEPNETESGKLIHRDDLDLDTVAEIEKLLAEQFPGMKVVFAGDEPGDTSPDIAAAIAAMDEMHAKSLADGTCVDCGKEQR